MEKRIQHLEKKIQQQLVEAKKKHQRKDKKGAVMHMKRKKMYEAEVGKLANAMMNLDQSIMALEGAAQNVDIMNAMSAGRDEFKNMSKQIDAEKVDDVMEDLTEQMDDAEQVGEALGAAMGNAALDDDDELLDELDALGEEDELGEELGDEVADMEPGAGLAMPGAPAAVIMPDAPGGVVMPNAPEGKVQMSEDEAALAALEAEMAM